MAPYPPNPPSQQTKKKKKNPLQTLVAGGCAGFVESSICHPLDTIKTRMQLRKNQVETLEKRVQHSLVEPALRFKHSLQEPATTAMRSSATVSSSSAGTTLQAEASSITAASLRGLPPAAAATAPQQHTSKVIVLNQPIRGTTVASLGPIGTAQRIVQREGVFSLYKGLTAVYTGIIPKMAIRFVSFEQYKDWLADYTPLGRSTGATFTAGLCSGLTEAVLVVTPAEVCKIRMQSQHHSLVDATQRQHRKYKNVFQTAFVLTKEEGLGALYKGVVPTMLRQGCNQAVNFTTYNAMKQKLLAYQNIHGSSQETTLPSYQSLVLGGISGGFGPLCNNPLDVVKTRLQKQVVVEGKTPKYTGLVQACVVIAQEEGIWALWKGITPRLMRIMPGQAITFMTYEFVTKHMKQFGLFQ